jgi:hypothetical protein
MRLTSPGNTDLSFAPTVNSRIFTNTARCALFDVVALNAQAQAWPDKPAKFHKESRALPFERQSHSFTRPAELSGFGRLAETCLSSAAEHIIEGAPQLDDWDKRWVPWRKISLLGTAKGDRTSKLKRDKLLRNQISNQFPMRKNARLPTALPRWRGSNRS